MSQPTSAINPALVSPTSQTPQEALLGQLRQLVPEAFSEGKLNLDTLRALVGEDTLAPRFEAYGLSWAGKRGVYTELKTPTTETLQPVPDASVAFDSTQNLFIEGDNLQVLKVLQKSYHHRIKMIYIDPPYNTGNDRFIYPDDFSETLADYRAKTGESDTDGNLTHTDGMKANRKENGQYHSNWLNMMYPRLALAKNLLRDDGVIFVSIDDNEVANLRLLMDEIFGEENFVNYVSVNMKNIAGASGGGEDKRLKKNIEYLLIYARNYLELKLFSNVFELIPLQELIESYREQGKSWKYTSVLKYSGDKEYLVSTVDGEGNEIKIFTRHNYEIKSINQICIEEDITEEKAYEKYFGSIFQTAMPQSSIRPRVMEKVEELGIDCDFYSIEYIPRSGRNKGKMYEQFYKGDSFRLLAWLHDVTEQVDKKLYKKEIQGTYWDFASETKNLSKEGDISFPNAKKPVKMLKKTLELVSSDNDIILDFFAGSSTTAHAVMDLNAEDGGQRQFIMVQLPEAIDPKDNKSAYEFCQNNGLPPTIAEISKERIRRAGKQILADNPDTTADLGFKAYRLSDSNFIPWQQPEQYDVNSLLAELEKQVNPIVDTASDADIVTELMLKEGYTLTASVQPQDGYYLITQDSAELDDKTASATSTPMQLAIVLGDMTRAKAEQIIALAPSKTIIVDSAFASPTHKNSDANSDANKANIVLQFENAGLVVGCV